MRKLFIWAFQEMSCRRRNEPFLVQLEPAWHLLPWEGGLKRGVNLAQLGKHSSLN